MNIAHMVDAVLKYAIYGFMTLKLFGVGHCKLDMMNTLQEVAVPLIVLTMTKAIILKTAAGYLCKSNIKTSKLLACSTSGCKRKSTAGNSLRRNPKGWKVC